MYRSDERDAFVRRPARCHPGWHDRPPAVAYTRAEPAHLASAGDPFVVDVLAGPRTRIDVIETR